MVVSTRLHTTATFTVHTFHSTGLRNNSQNAAVQYFQKCLHGKRRQFFFCMCCSHVELKLFFGFSCFSVSFMCMLSSDMQHFS